MFILQDDRQVSLRSSAALSSPPSSSFQRSKFSLSNSMIEGASLTSSLSVLSISSLASLRAKKHMSFHHVIFFLVFILGISSRGIKTSTHEKGWTRWSSLKPSLTWTRIRFFSPHYFLFTLLLILIQGFNSLFI